MRKNNKSKLNLNSNTIRALSGKQLEAVNGGSPPGSGGLNSGCLSCGGSCAGSACTFCACGALSDTCTHYQC